MSIKDTNAGYSWLTIALHWIVAAGMITLFVIGVSADEAATEEREVELLMLHVSIAMSLYVIFWARIIWRLANVRPALAPQAPLLQWLAYWVPLVLLAALAVQLVSGPITVLSTGNPIQVFGVTVVPAIMDRSETVHEIAETFHVAGATVILVAFGLHVLGVLKHLLINRDGTFRKMLVPGNRD